MKHICMTIAIVMLVSIAAIASVPLRWTVETSRTNVETFDAYHGETLDLDAALLSYGAPLPISGDVRLFYQTNGMDSAWWSVPATIAATNHLRASFAPASDPGAQQLNCFLGVTGSIYRAAFRIRFRNSPGEAPNVLQPPVKVLDYADLSVLNAPYWTKAEADNRYGGASITSNVVQQIADNTVARAGHVAAINGTATNMLMVANDDSGINALIAHGSIEYSYNGVEWYNAYLPAASGTIAYLDDLAVKIGAAAATNIAEWVVSTNNENYVASAGGIAYDLNVKSQYDDKLYVGDSAEDYVNIIFGQSLGIVYDNAARRLGVWPYPSVDYTNVDYLARESDLAKIPTTYGATNQLAAANCTVQTVVDPAGDTLPQFQVPDAVPGGIRDWVVHVVSSGSTDITLTGFPATVDSGKTANFFSPLDSVTNKCTHGTITTFYFSEINSTANAVNFMVNRAELKKISPAN